MNYNFNKIDNLLLLGGGPIMAQFIKEQTLFPINVITAERFLDETVLGEKITFKELLYEKNIPYIVSSDVNTDINVDRYVTVNTLGLSISAPWIIKQGFIDKFYGGKLINLHTSMIPAYRGGGGPSWKILNGERKGAYSVHFITTGIDDGDVIFSNEFDYPADHIYSEQWNIMDNQKCVEGLLEVLSQIKTNKNFSRLKQDEDTSVYFPRLNSKAQGYIDWKWSASEIVSFIHAFSFPFEGAKTFIATKILKIKKASLGRKKYYHPFMHGLVIRKNESEIVVAATDCEIHLTVIMNEQNNTCLNEIRLGDRLFTPESVLEEAITYRALYNSKGLVTKK